MKKWLKYSLYGLFGLVALIAILFAMDAFSERGTSASAAVVYGDAPSTNWAVTQDTRVENQTINCQTISITTGKSLILKNCTVYNGTAKSQWVKVYSPSSSIYLYDCHFYMMNYTPVAIPDITLYARNTYIDSLYIYDILGSDTSSIVITFLNCTTDDMFLANPALSSTHVMRVNWFNSIFDNATISMVKITNSTIINSLFFSNDTGDKLPNPDTYLIAVGNYSVSNTIFSKISLVYLLSYEDESSIMSCVFSECGNVGISNASYCRFDGNNIVEFDGTAFDNITVDGAIEVGIGNGHPHVYLNNVSVNGYTTITRYWGASAIHDNLHSIYLNDCSFGTLDIRNYCKPMLDGTIYSDETWTINVNINMRNVIADILALESGGTDGHPTSTLKVLFGIYYSNYTLTITDSEFTDIYITNSTASLYSVNMDNIYTYQSNVSIYYELGVYVHTTESTVQTKIYNATDVLVYSTTSREFSDYYISKFIDFNGTLYDYSSYRILSQSLSDSAEETITLNGDKDVHIYFGFLNIDVTPPNGEAGWVLVGLPIDTPMSASTLLFEDTHIQAVAVEIAGIYVVILKSGSASDYFGNDYSIPAFSAVFLYVDAPVVLDLDKRIAELEDDSIPLHYGNNLISIPQSTTASYLVASNPFITKVTYRDAAGEYHTYNPYLPDTEDFAIDALSGIIVFSNRDAVYVSL